MAVPDRYRGIIKPDGTPLTVEDLRGPQGLQGLKGDRGPIGGGVEAYFSADKLRTTALPSTVARTDADGTVIDGNGTPVTGGLLGDYADLPAGRQVSAGNLVVRDAVLYSRRTSGVLPGAWNAAEWIRLAPGLVDEISRYFPGGFSGPTGSGNSVSLGNFAGHQMVHNAAAVPLTGVHVQFPAHWQTAAVDVFWGVAQAGLTGAPTFQAWWSELPPDGGGSAAASGLPGSTATTSPSKALTQYEIYRTTVDEYVPVNPARWTWFRLARISTSAAPDGLAATVGVVQVRMRRTS